MELTSWKKEKKPLSTKAIEAMKPGDKAKADTAKIEGYGSLVALLALKNFSIVIPVP